MNTLLSLLLTSFVAQILCNLTVGKEEKVDYGYISHEMFLYFSEEQAIDVFKRPEFANRTEANLTLRAYFNTCLNRPRKLIPPANGVRKPFVVIESNHMPSRKIITTRMGRRLGGAILLKNPPKCLLHLQRFMESDNPLRSAFLSLGLYASAFRTTLIWNIKPVLMQGYWPDKLSFVISRTKDSMLPPPEDDVYDWPHDLLQPDIVFFIDFPDNLHYNHGTTRPPTSWKPKMVEVIRRMRGPPTFIFTTEGGFERTLESMEAAMIRTIEGKLDFQFIGYSKKK